MPIHPRGKSFQVTIHHNNERIRKSFKSKTEAELWEVQMKTALERGEILGESPVPVNTKEEITLKQLVNKTVRRYWRGKSGEKSATIYANRCATDLGEDLHPSQVTDDMIDEMIEEWEDEGFANSTINKRLSALSRMMDTAVSQGYIKKKPNWVRKKENAHRTRYLSKDEETALLSVLKMLHKFDYVDLFTVAIDTGMRMGEFIKLRKHNFDGHSITLWETKNNSERSIPLTKRSIEIMERRTKYLNPTDHVWKDLTNSKINNQWNNAKDLIGLSEDKQFVPHVLRHTFCSRLIQNGVDLSMVARLAGHKTLQTTMRYAHLSTASLKNAIGILDNLNNHDGLKSTLPEPHATKSECGVLRRFSLN